MILITFEIVFVKNKSLVSVTAAVLNPLHQNWLCSVSPTLRTDSTIHLLVYG